MKLEGIWAGIYYRNQLSCRKSPSRLQEMIFSLKRMNLAGVMEGDEAKKRLSFDIIAERYREMPIGKSLYRSFCQEIGFFTLPSVDNGDEVHPEQE